MRKKLCSVSGCGSDCCEIREEYEILCGAGNNGYTKGMYYVYNVEVSENNCVVSQ